MKDYMELQQKIADKVHETLQPEHKAYARYITDAVIKHLSDSGYTITKADEDETYKLIN